MTDWLRVRSDPIEAVETGVATTDTEWGQAFTGAATWDRIEYPVAQVIPEETVRQDGTNWRHEIGVALYFDRGRMDTELGSSEYVGTVLGAVADTIESVLTELEETPKVTDYHPARIEDYAGEYENTALLLVNIRFEVLSIVDPGTF